MGVSVPCAGVVCHAQVFVRHAQVVVRHDIAVGAPQPIVGLCMKPVRQAGIPQWELALSKVC